MRTYGAGDGGGRDAPRKKAACPVTTRRKCSTRSSDDMTQQVSRSLQFYLAFRLRARAAGKDPGVRWAAPTIPRSGGGDLQPPWEISAEKGRPARSDELSSRAQGGRRLQARWPRALLTALLGSHWRSFD